MLVIRFFRVGKKDQPAFKIVVTEKEKSSVKGLFIEEVGFYNPLTKEKVLREDRIKHWLSVGAQPSDTVHNLLVSAGLIEAKKIDVHKKAKKKEEKAAAAGEKPAEKPVEVKPKQTEEATEEKKEETIAGSPGEEKPTEKAVEQKPNQVETEEKKGANS